MHTKSTYCTHGLPVLHIMCNFRPTWIDVTRSSSLLKCCILIESCCDSARISSPARCIKSGSSWDKSNPRKSSSSTTEEAFATDWFLAWTKDACKGVRDLSSAESVEYTKCIIKLPISPTTKQKWVNVLIILFTWPTVYLQQSTLPDNRNSCLCRQRQYQKALIGTTGIGNLA